MSAAAPTLSVTENVTPPTTHHNPLIDQPRVRDWKVDQAKAKLDAGDYDHPDALDTAVDALAVELGLDRPAARDWQPGDTARLETPGGHYLVEVAQVHRSPETAVDAADYRVVEVIHADPVSGLTEYAVGMCPLVDLKLAEAA